MSEQPVAMAETIALHEKNAHIASGITGINEKAHSPAGDQSPTLADEPISAVSEKPKGAKFALIMVGLYLAVYILCLDISIIAPALPIITNDFGDTSKATWYFSVYLAMNTAFQPVCGPFFKLNPKYAFLTFLSVFEIGSLICAVAPSSNVFIFGRALAGVGSAGAFIGVMTVIALICEPHELAKYSNAVGALYSLGAVSGPLIGGAFTAHVTWRWCFYINLPIGGITLATNFFFLRMKAKNTEGTFISRLKRTILDVDWIGLVLFVGALIMLLMVLQWGNVKYPWNNSTIIGLLVGAILSGLALVPWCIWRGEHGYIRPRLLHNRTIAAAMLLNFCIAGAYLTIISVLSYYFEIRGSSALRAGVQLLPLIAGVVFGLIVGGGLVPVIGYVNPVLLAGLVIFLAGTGALLALDENSSTATWAGIEVLVGIGSGFAFMLPFVASQAVLKPEDIEVGTAQVLFMQTLGGAIVFGVGQTIWQNKYIGHLASLPGLNNGRQVAEDGVTAFITEAPAQLVEEIRKISIDDLRNAYYMPLALLGLSLLIWPFMEWTNVAPPPKEGKKSKDHPLEQNEKGAIVEKGDIVA